MSLNAKIIRQVLRKQFSKPKNHQRQGTAETVEFHIISMYLHASP